MKNVKITNLSDLELLNLFREGDDDAYAEIYQRYHKKMYFHAFKMLRDRDEALDVVQDIFLKLLDKRESVALNRSLSTYLYTAARNSILDIYSHEKVVAKHQQSLQSFIEKGEYITDNNIREKELTQIIEAEIAALPPKMRAVFELSREGQRSYRQIAQEMDMAENTVRKHITKALKKLRPKLSDFMFFGVIPLLFFLKKIFF